ncbi:MAG TPA: AI-2E family transporter [Methylomirabilota bacterium]|nr:AI-2E family transporter [Methylomirabilota bacterium]
MAENPKTINISTVTILKIVMVILLLWLFWLVRDVLLILLVSIIISSAMDPLADFLYKHKIPRGLSVLMVYIVVLGLIALVGFLLAPTIGAQFTEIRNADVFQSFISKIGVYRESLSHSTIGTSINNSLKEFTNNFGATIFQTTKGVLTGIISTITILVISFYLTAEESGMKNFIKHLAPFKHQAYVFKLVNQIQRKMGAWVLGQFILSAVIFGLVFIGLTVLKVKYALVLALIAGIFEIVPIIGPFISGVIACFFAFIQSPALAIAVLIMWVIAQQLESNIIVPIVMSKSVGLNPVLVILGILIGTTLGGIIGALLAVPIMSGISVFVSDVLEENELGS